MLGTWQFYVLVFLFIGSAQSGLLVIANATPMLNATASSLAFLAANAWILVVLRRTDQCDRPDRDGPLFRPDRPGRTPT